MRLSWTRGIFLSMLLVTSVFVIFSYENVNAQTNSIDAKSIGFEKTTIIEFENNNQEPVETIRMWLSGDIDFKSFKTEKGWTGKKTPQGVIVFTSTEPIMPGESVKFGIKTSEEKPGINWKALDKEDTQIGTGLSKSTELTNENTSGETTQTTDTTQTPDDKIEDGGVLTESTFRIIPEKPKVGSSIRVTGDNFAASQQFDFYIGSNKLASFETDENGHFMTSTVIPESQAADRTNFMIKDSQGNEKIVSLRIGELDNKMTLDDTIPLTISGTPSVVHRGQEVIVTGTATPNDTVTATVKNFDGEIVTTIAVDVDSNGNWKYETVVATDTPYGKYTAEITDGKEIILRSWTVESGKKIDIQPIKLKFEPGEIIRFNGTAVPNVEAEIVMEDPQGIEILADIFTPGADGFIEVELSTLLSSIEGTYVLFVTQEDETDITLVGLGELPQVQLITKMDQLNYQSNVNATIEISGPTSSTVSLLIIDPSDKNKFSDTVQLGPDGRAEYELDLTAYATGVYTTVITRGNAQAEDVFSVGLQTGSGPIEIRSTKTTYEPGEGVLLIGSTGENVLVTISMTDPNGEVVKIKETFTNKDGVLSESSFRIPPNAEPGTWVIKAESGPNFAKIDLDVVTEAVEGLILTVDEVTSIPGGKITTIRGLGAAVSQTVVIEVLAEDGVVVLELRTIGTGDGSFAIPWSIDKDFAPGDYTIKASDPFNEKTIPFTYNG